MALKQISVFVANQPGSLEKLVNILAEAGVDMRAMSIADTQEFGIMRMIVKGNTKACEALREAGYLVNISHVTAVDLGENRCHQPGAVGLLQAARLPQLRRLLLYGHRFHHADHGGSTGPDAARHGSDARNSG